MSKVCVEIIVGLYPGRDPQKSDLDRNFEALDKAIRIEENAELQRALRDTKSILEGIRDKLPDVTW